MHVVCVECKICEKIVRFSMREVTVPTDGPNYLASREKKHVRRELKHTPIGYFVVDLAILVRGFLC